jgi:hypothetical protein
MATSRQLATEVEGCCGLRLPTFPVSDHNPERGDYSDLIDNGGHIDAAILKYSVRTPNRLYSAS